MRIMRPFRTAFLSICASIAFALTALPAAAAGAPFAGAYILHSVAEAFPHQPAFIDREQHKLEAYVWTSSHLAIKHRLEPLMSKSFARLGLPVNRGRDQLNDQSET